MIANAANMLTLLRILLVPLFLYLVLNDISFWSMAVFAVAGLTDFFDGFLAKRFDMKTELGANLDPVADKLLLSSAFFALAFKGYAPLWLCVPVVIYDFMILAAVMVLRGAGKKVDISPSVAGKATTALQIMTVFYALARPNDRAFFLVAAITVSVTAYSGFSYAMREIRRIVGRPDMD